MAYNYDYGGETFSRPGASRRTRGMDIRSRGFGNEPKPSSFDSMRHSHYANYAPDSNRLNRSTSFNSSKNKINHPSGSREYSYKLDQIKNSLAEKNNPLLSFYKEK